MSQKDLERDDFIAELMRRLQNQRATIKRLRYRLAEAQK